MWLAITQYAVQQHHLFHFADQGIGVPVEGFEETMNTQDHAMLAQMRSCSAVGSLATVTDELSQFIRDTGADELMLVSSIFDHRKRLRSFELAAEAGRQINR